MELSRERLILAILHQAMDMRSQYRLPLSQPVRVHVPREIEGLLSFGDRYQLRETHGIEVWSDD